MTNSSNRNPAFTRLELLVVLATLAILAFMLMPALARTSASVARLTCAANLKQIGLASQNWRNAHLNLYPMNVLNRLGGPPVGTSTLASQADLPAVNEFSFPAPYMYAVFGTMSNELGTPKVIVCPSDERTQHSNFVMHVTGTVGNQTANPSASYTTSDNDALYFNNFKLSYFLGVNASDLHPQMFLAGDRNIWGDHTTTIVQPPWNGNGYGNLNSYAYWMGTNWGTSANYPAWSPSKMHQGKGNVLLADGSVQQLDSLHLRQQLAATGDTTNVPGPNLLLFP
jgi:prepilin-type processing-associated H-X9-DG protein